MTNFLKFLFTSFSTASLLIVQRIFALQYADRVLALGTARFQLRNFEVEDLTTEQPCDEGTKTEQEAENQEGMHLNVHIHYEIFIICIDKNLLYCSKY